MVTCPGGRTHIDKTQVFPDDVQDPPTQGHDRDMGTIENTAALYLRKSSVSNVELDDPRFIRAPLFGLTVIRRQFDGVDARTWADSDDLSHLIGANGV